jgi:hypothetical protein
VSAQTPVTPGDDLLFPSDHPLFALLRRSPTYPQIAWTDEGPTAYADVFVLADPATDELARQTADALSDPDGYLHFAIRLHQFVKNYRSHDAALSPAARAALNEPTYLFISDRAGGFAGQGFWLEAADGTLREMREVPYVDMQFSADELSGDDFGDVDQIFPHELGHVLLHELTGWQGQKVSTKIHFSTVRSDPWIALDEGWAEHFQPAAIDHTRSDVMRERRNQVLPSAGDGWYARFAREETAGCLFCPANLSLPLWQGGYEQHLRDGAVRENLFVHQVVLPPALSSGRRPPVEAMLYRDVIPPTTDAPLKNGAQMLASEGVMATLFYRLTTDPRLQNSYREAAFYEPFLLPSKSADWEQVQPEDLFAPQENAYLKLFDVFAHSVTWEVDGETSPAIAVIAAYAEQFPDEAAAVYDIFLDVTQGATVETAAFSQAGRPDYLPGLRERLLRGEVRLDDNLGPQLWPANTGFRGGGGVWRYFDFLLSLLQPYTFDLNAADAADLRSVPGVTAALADDIVAARERQGHFHSLADLAEIEGVTPEVLEQFYAMQTEMEGFLAQQQDQALREEELHRDAQQQERDTPPPGEISLEAIFLPVLVACYALAGLLQIVRLLAATALMYGMVHLTARLWRRRQAGAPAEGGRLRRALRRVLGGLGVALLAFSVSLGLYAAGLTVTLWLTSVCGALCWTLLVLLRTSFTCSHLADRYRLAWNLLAWVAAFAVTGAMY